MSHALWTRTVVVTLVASAVLAATKLVAESSESGIYLMLAAAALIALADLLAEIHVSVAVFIYSSAAQMVTAVVLSSVALSLLFAQWAESPLETPVAVSMMCLGVGGLAGIAVRDRFLASYERRRAGEETASVRLHLVLAVGILVLLFPESLFGYEGASWYTVGFGAGFSAHFLGRRAEQRMPRVSKLARRIRKSLHEIDSKALVSVEFRAVQLFARQRWRSLEGLLEQHRDELTLGLRIVEATRERIAGKMYEAVQTLRDGVAAATDADRSYLHLAWLLLALCYRDLGQRDSMWMALEKSREHRADCLLLLFVYACCLIEELPLPSESHRWQQHGPARVEARDMLELALRRLLGARPESAIAAVVACGLPLTRRFVDDTYGYLLLKCGARSPAKAILEACLRENSRSASSHLHLGEYYLDAELSSQQATEEERTRHRRAKQFCLRMAVALSGKRDSHTRRRAQSLLEAERTSPRRPGIVEP